jgi:hypothetical protein
MKEVRAIVDESAKSFATLSLNRLASTSHRAGMGPTSAILLIFSLRSFSEKPRSLFRPNRTLSPSRRYAARPRWRRCCSSAVAMVDFPDAERPVNHIVNPRCFRNSLRSCRESDGCQVIFLRIWSTFFPRRRAGSRGNHTLPLSQT